MNRRTYLRASVTAVGVTAFAGCLASGGGEDVPAPVDLSGTKFDYQGGMEIGAHGGPNGQIFYKDEQPRPAVAGGADGDTSSPENLAWFHTLVFGLFPYHFDRQSRGWETDVIYVTDYTLVDWDIAADESRPVMPSPTSAEMFAEASELTYVGGSEVMGGMGPALHPFSDSGEASSFVENYGGDTYEFDEINQALVESLQANSEQGMEM